VHTVAMAAMAKLVAGVVPHLTPFFHSTKCATAAASSCLTSCACSLEPSPPPELRLWTPPWLTSRGHTGHHGQAALGHRATNQSLPQIRLDSRMLRHHFTTAGVSHRAYDVVAMPLGPHLLMATWPWATSSWAVVARGCVQASYHSATAAHRQSAAPADRSYEPATSPAPGVPVKKKGKGQSCSLPLSLWLMGPTGQRVP
jgi:hypothetical protein